MYNILVRGVLDMEVTSELDIFKNTALGQGLHATARLLGHLTA